MSQLTKALAAKFEEHHLRPRGKLAKRAARQVLKGLHQGSRVRQMAQQTREQMGAVHRQKTYLTGGAPGPLVWSAPIEPLTGPSSLEQIAEHYPAACDSKLE